MALFTAFFRVGVLGFGGVAAWVRHVMVVERAWLNDVEFAELFGVASTLPGANTVNFATMFGDRYGGLSGAVVALAGLIGAPALILIAIASLYTRYAGLQDVRSALTGAAAAAAGLVIGTALKLLRHLTPDWIMILVVVAVFAASALAGVPIVAILAAAVPICLAAAALRDGAR